MSKTSSISHRSSAFIVASALAAIASCQSANQKLAYPRFASAMAEYEDDFEWEPIEFTTEDGYVLTSFIIKKKDQKNINPPVLVHHGNGQDAATWIKTLTPENPRFKEVEVQVLVEPEEPAEPAPEETENGDTEETSATDETTTSEETEATGETTEVSDETTATEESTSGSGGTEETTIEGEGEEDEEEEELPPEPVYVTEIKQVRFIEDTPFML